MGNNPVRGCGQKVKGGSYLEGEFSPMGSLRAWSWVLGDHLTGGINVFTDDAPKRAMAIINPAATLLSGRMVLEGAAYDPPDVDAYERLLLLVGKRGLLDHVGRRYYTPESFAAEARRYGVSRRVSRDFMIGIAPSLPLPVFFCTGGLPLFRDSEARRPYVGMDDGTATWLRSGWGLTVRKEQDGGDHFLVRQLDREWSGDGIMPTPMIFGAGWVTRGTYVLRDGDDSGVNGTNVENITLED